MEKKKDKRKLLKPAKKDGGKKIHSEKGKEKEKDNNNKEEREIGLYASSRRGVWQTS